MSLAMLKGELECETPTTNISLPQTQQRRVLQKSWSVRETREKGQTQIIIMNMKAKKRLAEMHFHQLMIQALKKLETNRTHETNEQQRSSQSEYNNKKQDTNTIVLRQEIDAGRAENIRRRHQAVHLETVWNEIQVLQREIHILRMNMSNSTLSTEMCSSFENSIEQRQIESCLTQSSEQLLQVPKGISFCKRFLNVPFISRRESAVCSTTSTTTTAQTNRRTFASLHNPCQKAFCRDWRGNKRFLDLQAQYDNLQKRHNELMEHNRQLQQGNEKTERLVSRLYRQIALLSQPNPKCVSSNLFNIPKILQMKSHIISSHFMVDRVDSHSDDGDDTWTLQQRSDDSLSNVSSLPIVALEFIPRQRLSI